MIFVDIIYGSLIGAVFSAFLIFMVGFIGFLFTGEIVEWDFTIRMWVFSLIFTIPPGLIGRFRFLIFATSYARNELGLPVDTLWRMPRKERENLFRRIQKS